MRLRVDLAYKRIAGAMRRHRLRRSAKTRRSNDMLGPEHNICLTNHKIKASSIYLSQA